MTLSQISTDSFRDNFYTTPFKREERRKTWRGRETSLYPLP